VIVMKARGGLYQELGINKTGCSA